MDDLSTEKRACRRYDVTDFVVAVFSTRLGRVVNISRSGLAIQLTDTDFETLPDECKTSLLSRSNGFLIKDVSLKLVRREVMLSVPINSAKLQTIGAKFHTSDSIQLSKIKRCLFLWSYS
ncbi:MAG: PilZ domain-containing protein [Desulfobulbaceae bacterium]|uniref:PilZ domain-containing protein n=1 Tax=Candidatus Desulfobia pelagia TaxID=2841692 RepID=A0A8J6NE03_9BACT|nr:PilZ domain-containing protein [Candidatus Desulfobia pelagia]